MKGFKVNEYITLKLEDRVSNIYIFNYEKKKFELFNHCKYVLMRKTIYELEDLLEDIKSVDELAEHLDRSLEEIEPEENDIPAETRFWVHCSNMQVWAENDYDTRLLHSNLAFPLLKRLVEVGDSKAKKVFKEEIAKRLKEASDTVIKYLINEEYLNLLYEQEIKFIIKDCNLIKKLITLGYKNENYNYRFDELLIVLEKLKSLDLNYFKDLLINLLKSENTEVCYYLDEHGIFTKNLKVEEIIYTILNPEEANIIFELKEIIGQYNFLTQKKELSVYLNPKNRHGIIHLKNHSVVGLHLGNRKIEEFPIKVLDLKNLRNLNLQGNFLNKIPNSISKLNKLIKLNLTNNELCTIPNSIGDLKNLKQLKIGRNKLKTIPDSIGNLNKLELLDISNNEINSIPNSIGNLENLWGLNLRDNYLKIVPDSINQLKNLKELDLRGNNIKYIPKRIQSRKNEIEFNCFF